LVRSYPKQIWRHHLLARVGALYGNREARTVADMQKQVEQLQVPCLPYKPRTTNKMYLPDEEQEEEKEESPGLAEHPDEEEAEGKKELADGEVNGPAAIDIRMLASHAQGLSGAQQLSISGRQGPNPFGRPDKEDEEEEGGGGGRRETDHEEEEGGGGGRREPEIVNEDEEEEGGREEEEDDQYADYDY
jgi:hypothetical protein